MARWWKACLPRARPLVQSQALKKSIGQPVDPNAPKETALGRGECSAEDVLLGEGVQGCVPEAARG